MGSLTHNTYLYIIFYKIIVCFVCTILIYKVTITDKCGRIPSEL